MSPDPSEHSDDSCVINDALNPQDNIKTIGGASLVEIHGSRWYTCRLQLCFRWSTDETQWGDFRDTKIDFPRQSATYINTHYKSRSSDEGRDRALS